MRRRLSAYIHERAGAAIVAARQDACTNCEEACERRHRDHKTHCYALDLLPDEGHWIGRPEQVGEAFSDIKEHRRVHGQAYGMDVDINGKKPANHTVGNLTLLLKFVICNFTLQNLKFPNKKETLGVAQRFGCGSDVLHQEHH